MAVSQSWLLKPRFLVTGVIYAYGGEDDAEEYTKGKQVPHDKIIATLEGCWRGEVRWKGVGEQVSSKSHGLNDT